MQCQYVFVLVILHPVRLESGSRARFGEIAWVELDGASGKSRVIWSLLIRLSSRDWFRGCGKLFLSASSSLIPISSGAVNLHCYCSSLIHRQQDVLRCAWWRICHFASCSVCLLEGCLSGGLVHSSVSFPSTHQWAFPSATVSYLCHLVKAPCYQHTGSMTIRFPMNWRNASWMVFQWDNIFGCPDLASWDQTPLTAGNSILYLPCCISWFYREQWIQCLNLHSSELFTQIEFVLPQKMDYLPTSQGSLTPGIWNIHRLI